MPSQNTNMDLKKKSNADGPQLEFTLPLSEIGQNLEIGQCGYVTIPVEVTQVKSDGMVSFRKRGKSSGDRWRQPSLQEMEDEIGTDSEEK